MRGVRGRWMGWVVVAAVGGAAVGCRAKSSTDVGRRARPAEEPQLAVNGMDAGGRVRAIAEGTRRLETIAAQLPGDDDATNRRLVGEAFGALERVLPMIEGEYQTGEFRQSMQILRSSRQQLMGGSMDLAAEPTIGQGVRAASRVLAGLNAYVFNNDEAIGKKVTELNGVVGRLDATRGMGNRVVVAQSMQQAAGVLQQMSNELAGRVGAATTQPAGGQQPTTAAR